MHADAQCSDLKRCTVQCCIFLHAQLGCVSYVYDGPTLHLRFLYWGSQGFFQAMHCLRLYDDTSTFYIYLDMESHNSMIHIDVLLLFFVLICVLIVCVCECICTLQCFVFRQPCVFVCDISVFVLCTVLYLGILTSGSFLPFSATSCAGRGSALRVLTTPVALRTSRIHWLCICVVLDCFALCCTLGD